MFQEILIRLFWVIKTQKVKKLSKKVRKISINRSKWGLFENHILKFEFYEVKLSRDKISQVFSLKT